MKKILYIVPILVFAMVAMSQDANAQSGQTGNASNAITQAAVSSVTQAALAATATGGNGGSSGGATVSGNGNFIVQAPAAITVTLPSSPTSFSVSRLTTGGLATPIDSTPPTSNYTVVPTTFNQGSTVFIRVGANLH